MNWKWGGGNGGSEKVSTAACYILHVGLLKQALLLMRCRSVSVSLFVSYRLSTMPSVVSQGIFPWSPVSTYKSQQCCQNSRTASAESICKVSSWAIASSWALQYPVILCCLWPLSATQSFFTAVLRITLISHQSASINSKVLEKMAFGLRRFRLQWAFLTADIFHMQPVAGK